MILLDSGAYSAFKSMGRLSIELADYIAYLQHNRHLLHAYISLDHIPGKNGRRVADPLAAQLSYENHQKMKAAGLAPWPVFHRQDDFGWLHRYIADGEKYIALAPHPIKANEVIPWLRSCFAMIPASVRVHGLGLSNTLMLKHFPLASVDSTSWVERAANYDILVPTFSRGRPDFKHRPRQISVTERPSSQAIHVDRCNSFVREQVEQFLEEAGTTLAELRISKPARMRTNLKYFAGLAASTNTRLFYVTQLDHEQHEALSQSGAWTRLLSFAALQDKREGTLEKYCGGTNVKP